MTDIADTKKAEALGYSKGYQAGLRRQVKEHERMVVRYNDLCREMMKIGYKDRKERLFCAALTGVLSRETSWTMDGGPVNNADRYVDLANYFATASIKKLNE